MVATSFIIALNILIYFFQYFIYNSYEFSIYFGLNELFFAGAYWQLLTTMFIHGSFMHIAMNMAVLYQFGMLLERYLGTFRFFVLYFLGGLITSLLSLSYFAFESVNLVGASGAICVLLGFLAFIDAFNRKGLFIAVLVMSFAPLLLDINVAWYAHIFGFIVGFGAGYFRILR